MSLDKNNISNLLKKYGNNFVKYLTTELLNSGKKSSGNLIKSLSSDVKPVAKYIQIQIKSADYLINVDKGRKKGKYPPVQEIAKWCKIKNIPTSAAFPIARNIFKFGIKPTNVIDKAIKKFMIQDFKKLNDDLVKEVSKAAIKQLKKLERK